MTSKLFNFLSILHNAIFKKRVHYHELPIRERFARQFEAANRLHEALEKKRKDESARKI